jgi:small conductance mechanosensitive channel
MKCDLNGQEKERFDRQGVEIPYPYRTFVFKNNVNESSQSSQDIPNQ